MSGFPKDGSTFVVECIDRTAYRWAKYKPQGAKQMGKPGRWQKQVINGDWHKWENCEEPVGEISPPAKDGPISKAFKQSASIRSLLLDLEGYFDSRADAEYHADGTITGNDEMLFLADITEVLDGWTA